jgi:nucleotide-binding universal stress UspA family protein
VKILVCIDGEPHSKSAIQQAIVLGLSSPAEVTALHVIDPWLKKFYNELYSQGRKQYLEYVDECLQAQAEQVYEEFNGMCLAAGLEARFKVRHGEPIAEILEEVRQVAPDLLITGSKQLSAWGRLRSGNLPLRLRKKLGRQASLISIKLTEPLLAKGVFQSHRLHPIPEK